MIVSKSAVDVADDIRVKFISAEQSEKLDADSAKLRYYGVSAYVYDNCTDG